MVRWLHVLCKCRRLTAERKVWRGDARWELLGTRLRLPEAIKVSPRRLKKCQASHARHVGHMFIMRRRRHCRPTAGSVPLLSITQQDCGVRSNVRNGHLLSAEISAGSDVRNGRLFLKNIRGDIETSKRYSRSHRSRTVADRIDQ